MSHTIEAPPDQPGFVGLRTPMGEALVMFGFLLVGLIVVAGGIVTRFIERENIERRKLMKQEIQRRAQEENQPPDSESDPS